MDNNIIIYIVIFLVSAVIFTFVGMLIRKKVAESKIKSAEEEAKNIVKEANKEAEQNKKEAIFKANEEIMKSRKDLDEEIRERRAEVQSQEKRLNQREENLDKRTLSLEKKEDDMNSRLEEIEKRKQEVEELHEQEEEKIQKIAQMTKEEAKQHLLEEVKKDIIDDESKLIKQSEENIKEKAEKTAKEVIGYAIQKCAADHTTETTVSIVSLPNDEMKGRIIGREGRNIKSLEQLTGVDLIIDDTPEAVVISGFDPLRREIAKMSIEKLIDDGRIHPAKIEEMVEKSREELEQTIKKTKI